MTLQQLAGIRVVAFEQYIAGPYCTAILADAGAEVIKIEQPGSGDPRRHYLPRASDDHPEVNAGFVPYNRGKQSIELDIRTDEGRERMLELLADADVLVSNLRPGALTRAGLDPAQLRTTFPRLIVCEITGFGTTGGPYASWPAFDSVVQAMSGLSSLLGDTAESPPGLAPMSTMDLLGGIYAALGILMALQGRERTGEGCHVDAAMYDIGAAFLMRPLTIHEFTGETPTRGQDDHSPVGAFQTGTGEWISIVIPTDEMWRRTCTAMGREELADHPDLVTNEGRAKAMQTVILPALTEWARDLTGTEAAARLRETGQPAGLVQTIRDVRNDPQLNHRGLFVGIEGFEDTIRVPRLPLLFDGKGSTAGKVPALGEHD